MAKRQLNRRQNWRIEKIQGERAARAAKREQHALQELEGGDLGPEQLGLVIAHFGVQVEVEAQDGDVAGQIFRCHLRANLPALVTGDRVVWRAGNQGIGVIVAQMPRSTELCRPNNHGQLKPVAANVDLIVIVFAPAPEPHPNLIDRYLVAAEHAGIRPLLLLNKADLINDENAPALQALLEVYRELGYPLLIGTSRKRFLGALLPGPDGAPVPPVQRDDATAATSAISAYLGAWCVRVHDVPATVAAVRVAQAWRRGSAGV